MPDAQKKKKKSDTQNGFETKIWPFLFYCVAALHILKASWTCGLFASQRHERAEERSVCLAGPKSGLRKRGASDKPAAAGQPPRGFVP